MSIHQLRRNPLVTPERRHRRALLQILLLAAGFLVLVMISAASVLLINKARDDSAWVVHSIEVENQTNALLLEVRRAESSARGYVLTSGHEFLKEYEDALAAIQPELDRLERLTTDNPSQRTNIGKLRDTIKTHLDRVARQIEAAKRGDIPGAAALLRTAATADTAVTIQKLADAMLAEENRLFDLRSSNADRTQRLSSMVTIAGSALLVAFAGMSIVLLRRSARARDDAEAALRDANLNLEATVDERTADLREANDEIQRFAYIVSHDLRSPLVNIMGFTSELEELRGDIFKRIAALARATTSPDAVAAGDTEPVLGDLDRKLSQDFSEALSFIKSSIGKMDRLISAILSLTREGRRQFEPVPIDTRQLIESVVTTLAHQAAEAEAKIEIENVPNVISDRLALEQIFSNLVDNAIKYLKPGVPGVISVKGRTNLLFRR